MRGRSRAPYALSAVTWKPELSYRYAFFQEYYRTPQATKPSYSLLTGFYDWGTWWQGEIAGEYFLSNSNLLSQLVRVHLSPSEGVGGGLMFYSFEFDQPAPVGPGVTSTDAAFEFDAYVDWKVNATFTIKV